MFLNRRCATELRARGLADMKTPRVILLRLAIASLALAVPGISNSRAQTPTPFAEEVDAAIKSWQKSCVKPDAQGRCFAVAKQDSLYSCSSDGELLRPGKRRGAAAKGAQQRLEALIARHEAAPQLAESAANRSALQRALFHAAESRFERALLLRPPTDLNFSESRPALKRRSEQRFVRDMQASRGHG